MAHAPSIPDADAFNWIIGPASRCVLAVSETTRVSSLLNKALNALANQGRMLAIAQTALELAGKNTDALKEILADQEINEQWANEVLDGRNDAVHTSGIVFLWTSLEVAVEDTAVLILLHDPSVVATLVSMRVNVPKQLSNPLSESDAKKIFSRFDREAPPAKGVSEWYCSMLETMGLQLSVDADTHTKISELNYVRNCILHRGGVVDDKVKTEAPGLDLEPGAMLRMDHASYLKYLGAAGRFATQLITAACNSRHVRTL